MRKLQILQILCLAELLLSAAESPTPSDEDMLKKLSAAGEQYVDEEIKRALLGVQKVAEMMEEKEEEHRQLMDALRQSSDKKKGAMNLVQETQQKLEEAEQQCQDVTRSSFGKCRPCLENTCKTFYTSTCRRGFSSFSDKVEEFFKKMAAQLEATEQVYNQKDITRSPDKVAEEEADLELLQADASFSQLMSNISLLHNHSVVLVRKMQQVFGRSFLAAFNTELQPSPLSGSATERGSSADPVWPVDLHHIVDSVYDFGKNVLQELSSTVADVFEEMEEEADEYFHYPECPRVQQLHSEMEEMHVLLNASRQQFSHRLQLVHRHTADTQRWLSDRDDQYGWVRQLSDRAVGPDNIFTVITVNPEQQLKNVRTKTDSSVAVTLLDSGPITVSVPAELEVDDPAFIQYVAQEALVLHKQLIRGTD
ncbi:uncharacterized protein V6R79_025340 [Siganus canaliculatus]